MRKNKKKEENQKLLQQINELENKWKRALADYANLEKRIDKEKEDFVKFSNALLLRKLLDVLDNLERAESFLKNEGLTLAVNQFRQVLKSEGVEEISALNKKFDPEKMECIETLEGEKDRVLEVLQKGYLLNQKVLRPAKVKVGKGGSAKN